MSVPAHPIVPTWIREPRSFTVTDEEAALVATARRLGLSHLLQTYNRYAEDRPTRELIAILYWRAARWTLARFRRIHRPPSSPEVAALRRVIADARERRMAS